MCYHKFDKQRAAHDEPLPTVDTFETVFKTANLTDKDIVIVNIGTPFFSGSRGRVGGGCPAFLEAPRPVV